MFWQCKVNRRVGKDFLVRVTAMTLHGNGVHEIRFFG